MPLRDGFFSTATQTSCCNRIQRSNRVRLLVVSTHDFPDSTLHTKRKRQWYKRYSEKATSPSKQKGEKKETRVAIGAPAHRRTIERSAAASTIKT